MTFRFPGKMNDFVRKFIREILGEKNKEKDCGKRRKNFIWYSSNAQVVSHDTLASLP